MVQKSLVCVSESHWIKNEAVIQASRIIDTLQVFCSINNVFSRYFFQIFLLSRKLTYLPLVEKVLPDSSQVVFLICKNYFQLKF